MPPVMLVPSPTLRRAMATLRQHYAVFATYYFTLLSRHAILYADAADTDISATLR